MSAVSGFAAACVGVPGVEVLRYGFAGDILDEGSLQQGFRRILFLTCWNSPCRYFRRAFDARMLALLAWPENTNCIGVRIYDACGAIATEAVVELTIQVQCAKSTATQWCLVLMHACNLAV
jgi:hypothetical protein